MSEIEIPLKPYSVVEIDHVDFEEPQIPVIATDWIIPETDGKGGCICTCTWIDSEDVPEHVVEAVKNLKNPPEGLKYYPIKRIVTSAGIHNFTSVIIYIFFPPSIYFVRLQMIMTRQSKEPNEPEERISL